MVKFNKKIHFHGNPCRKCGNTMRYKKNYKECVHCKLEKRKEYYQENREREIARAIQWQKDNPERAKEIHDKFLANNPGYHTKWQRSNPEKVAKYVKKYRDRINREKKEQIEKYFKELEQLTK